MLLQHQWQSRQAPASTSYQPYVAHHRSERRNVCGNQLQSQASPLRSDGMQSFRQGRRHFAAQALTGMDAAPMVEVPMAKKLVMSVGGRQVGWQDHHMRQCHALPCQSLTAPMIL
jgi:hypothetical protein